MGKWKPNTDARDPLAKTADMKQYKNKKAKEYSAKRRGTKLGNYKQSKHMGAPRKYPRKKLGAPKKVVDANRVRELIADGFTAEYTAYMMGCGADLLKEREDLALAVAQGKALRNGCLQNRQFQIAMAGSGQLLIWLGKQWLGQRDKTEVVSMGDPLADLLNEMRGKSKKVGAPEEMGEAASGSSSESESD